MPEVIRMLRLATKKPQCRLLHDWSDDIVISVAGGKIVSRRLKMPAGFVSDCSSIPRLLFWQIVGDAYATPMVCAVFIHDFLYSKQCALKLKRREADVAFFEMLIDADYLITALLLFMYVRATGWLAWKRK